MIKLNGHEVIDVVIAGVDPKDHPDYVDAYIESARWSWGDPLSYDQLDRLTRENGDWINQNAFETLL